MTFAAGVRRSSSALNCYSIRTKEKTMTKREKLLDEVFEAALQNDMKYFG
jgi:hypothetical protein